jgi:hypothetical protein
VHFEDVEVVGGEGRGRQEGKELETKTEKMTVRSSVSASIMVGPCSPRCLQISAILCVLL